MNRCIGSGGKGQGGRWRLCVWRVRAACGVRDWDEDVSERLHGCLSGSFYTHEE